MVQRSVFMGAKCSTSAPVTNLQFTNWPPLLLPTAKQKQKREGHYCCCCICRDICMQSQLGEGRKMKGSLHTSRHGDWTLAPTPIGKVERKKKKERARERICEPIGAQSFAAHWDTHQERVSSRSHFSLPPALSEKKRKKKKKEGNFINFQNILPLLLSEAEGRQAQAQAQAPSVLRIIYSCNHVCVWVQAGKIQTVRGRKRGRGKESNTAAAAAAVFTPLADQQLPGTLALLHYQHHLGLN